MESFEELELSPELVEALAAEGIEVPTPLQANAIPVLRRGGSVVFVAGPGGGSFAAYGPSLLDRIEAAGNHPRALVLSPSRERSRALALALGRLALATGHRIGALGVPWAFPERADVLFATLDDLQRGVRSSEVKIDRASTLVLDGASTLLEDESERVTQLLQGMDREGFQLVFITDSVTPALRAFVEQHARRAVFLPSESAAPDAAEAPLQRGTLRLRIVEGEREDALPGLLLELFESGSGHVLLFAHSEDRAADIGDYLALHGFSSGAPGDPEVPVWLGVNPLEARSAMKDAGVGAAAVATISIEPPLDADELDRRHGGGGAAGNANGFVVATSRELPHLRRIARTAGYTIDIVSPKEGGAVDEASTFLAEIERVVADEDLLPHLVLLEPLIRKVGAVQVAAALGFLLRKRALSARVSRTDGSARSESVSRPPAWARLFLSVGEKDGVSTRDLLGAIIGEAGVAGDEVGRIDLRETFAKVEVQEQVAERVIRALNGTSIRGRSVRADFDRGEASRSPGKGGDRGRGDKGRPGSKGDDRPRRSAGPATRGARPAGGDRGKGGGGKPYSRGKADGGGKGRRSDSPKPGRPD